MKRTISLLLVLCILLFTITGCDSSENVSTNGGQSSSQLQGFETKDIKDFSIATSMITGTFYILATPLAELINNMEGYSATPEASDGSASNVQMIENEEVYLAITSALTAYQGYNGTGFAEKLGTKDTGQRAFVMTHSS